LQINLKKLKSAAGMAAKRRKRHSAAEPQPNTPEFTSRAGQGKDEAYLQSKAQTNDKSLLHLKQRFAWLQTGTTDRQGGGRKIFAAREDSEVLQYKIK
jgi:hypothetical protein